MNEYSGNIELDQAAALIRETTGPIVVLTHAKPDGDAFGSTVALLEGLKLLGREAFGYFVAPMPATLADMAGAEEVTVVGPDETPMFPEASLYIVLDTGAWSQLGAPGKIVARQLERTLILDHHVSGDVAAAHRYVNGQRAATAEIVAELLALLLADRGGLEASTAPMRDGLFVGIASDTGWFRFSSTRPETHQLAARLMRQGVDHAELYRQLEQKERAEKVMLLGRALNSLQLLCDGRAAVMVLRAKDFEETGALQEETERLIDQPQQIASVQVVVMLSEKPVENGGTVTRMSFRSKPGGSAINVSELAGRFGGGGHARAAGAQVDEPVDTVLPRLHEVLGEVACAV